MRDFFIAATVTFVVGSGAAGQDSQLIHEVSTDGGNNWSSTADVLPGSTIQIRVRCRLLPGTSTLGLAGLTFQPILTGWRGDLGDSRTGFTFPGLGSSISSAGLPLGVLGNEQSYAGRHVANTPSNTGRMFPFGTVSQDESSTSRLLTSFNDPGQVLRFAGARNTTPTQNEGWGVIISQWQPNSSQGYFVSSRSPTIFKYAVTLSSNPQSRSLTATTPIENVSRGVCFWYRSTDGSQSLESVLLSPANATINVVPTPGAAVVVTATGLGLFGLRRRNPR